MHILEHDILVTKEILFYITLSNMLRKAKISDDIEFKR